MRLEQTIRLRRDPIATILRVWNPMAATSTPSIKFYTANARLWLSAAACSFIANLNAIILGCCECFTGSEGFIQCAGLCGRRRSILTLALLHILGFLTSDTFAPSRWDRQDPGLMTAALHNVICRLDPRQFELRTRRLQLQSGDLRGAFLQAFRKTPWRGAGCFA